MFIKSCISLIIVMLVVLKPCRAQYGTTTNQCSYKSGLRPSGVPVTGLHVDAISTDANLALCCDLCRSLSFCIAWQFEESYQQCGFYSTVTGFVTDSSSYAGKTSGSNFWTCNEGLTILN